MVTKSSRSSRKSEYRIAVYCMANVNLCCERNPKHVEWVRSFVAILEEMRKYVKEYHLTGLAWNPKVCTLCLIHVCFA